MILTAQIHLNTDISFTSIDYALAGAEGYNKWDFVFGHSPTYHNQPNHTEAIARGYVTKVLGTSSTTQRDDRIQRILTAFYLGL